MKLSQKIVDAALYEGRSYMSKAGRKRWSQHVLWDDDLPGFGLRISSRNRKSFFVSYRAGGRKRTKTLGTADKMELEEARRRAAELLASLDEEPRARPVAPPQIDGVETVAQLADAYLEDHLKSSTPSWFADQRLMRTHIKPAMGRSRIAEVSQTDLAALRNRVARRFPADARRLKPLLAGMFDWAADRGLWARGQRPAGPPAARPPDPAGTPREAGPAAEGAAEAGPEPPPEPPRSPEELAEALRRSEEERRELAARLEEVSSSGVDMLARINEQAAAQKEIEASLAKSRRELERARTGARGRPDPEKTAQQIHNLRQSVEQLMASLEEARGERDEMAERLADTEGRAGRQARQVAALVRSRDELEERLREEERKAATRKVQRRGAAGRRPLVIAAAAGAVAGALLTLLLQGTPGAVKAPLEPAAGEAVASRSRDPEARAEPIAAEVTAAAPVTGTEPEPAGIEPQAQPRAAEGAPPDAADVDEQSDVAAAEAAVRSWAAAWSEQRVDDYLAAYSARFTPAGGLGRGEWASQRRNRILRPASIQVTLRELEVTVAGPDQVQVSFEQSYETPTYADRVVKTLDLAREEGGWKILAERSR